MPWLSEEEKAAMVAHANETLTRRCRAAKALNYSYVAFDFSTEYDQLCRMPAWIIFESRSQLKDSIKVIQVSFTTPAFLCKSFKSLSNVIGCKGSTH